MSGTSDPDVFALAMSENYVVLTENVADFVTIAAEHSTTGARHPGVLIALSSRFSRRASRRAAPVNAIQAHKSDELGARTSPGRAAGGCFQRGGKRPRSRRPDDCFRLSPGSEPAIASATGGYPSNSG
jgi:hypothetical protein